jgi:ABC-type multidrug transport system fused ATPase/permease subunit
MNAITILFFVCAAMDLVIYMVCTPFFIIYRNEVPIKYRCPGIKILAATSAIISIAVRICHDFWFSWEGFKAIERIGWNVAAASLLPVFIRHYHLLRKSKLLQEGKLVTFSYYATVRGAWFVYLICASVPICTLIIIAFVVPPDQVLNRIGDATSILMLAQCVIAGLFLAWYIFGAKRDSLHIKTQFITFMVFATLYAGVALLVTLFGIGEIEKILLAIIVPTILLVIDFALPVIVSIRLQRMNKQTVHSIEDTNKTEGETVVRKTTVDSLARKALSRSNISSKASDVDDQTVEPIEDLLDQILLSEKLSASFSRFLAREYCLEYLMFLQAVESYRYNFYDESTVLLRQMKEQIIEEYLLPNAVNEIDVPARVQEKYWMNTPLQADLFLEVEAYVKQYLIEHHVSRFQLYYEDSE